jgi:hypothetical protein
VFCALLKVKQQRIVLMSTIKRHFGSASGSDVPDQLDTPLLVVSQFVERGIYAASAWPCRFTLKRPEGRAPRSNQDTTPLFTGLRLTRRQIRLGVNAHNVDACSRNFA